MVTLLAERSDSTSSPLSSQIISISTQDLWSLCVDRRGDPVITTLNGDSVNLTVERKANTEKYTEIEKHLDDILHSGLWIQFESPRQVINYLRSSDVEWCTSDEKDRYAFTLKMKLEETSRVIRFRNTEDPAACLLRSMCTRRRDDVYWSGSEITCPDRFAAYRSGYH